MIEDKNEADAEKFIDRELILEVSAKTIPNTILTPMNAAMDEKSPYFDGRKLGLIERFYKKFARLFSGW